MRIANDCFLVIATLLFLEPIFGMSEEPTWAERVHQNELLRDHYLDELFSSGHTGYRYSSTPPYSKAEIPSSLGSVQASRSVEVDRVVDARITRLIRRINEGFADLTHALEVVALKRDMCVDAAAWNRLPRKERKETEKALKTVRDRSRNVRDTLRVIYPSIASEYEGQALEGLHREGCHSEEIDRLMQAARQTEEKVRSALAGSYVVILDELNNTFLVGLDQTAQWADELRRRIR